MGTSGVDGGEAFGGVEIGGIELADFEVIDFCGGEFFCLERLVGAFGERSDFRFFGASGEEGEEGEEEGEREEFHG